MKGYIMTLKPIAEENESPPSSTDPNGSRNLVQSTRMLDSPTKPVNLLDLSEQISV